MISKDNDLNGVVLAGGKSKRMGQDKGAMLWHGIEQRFYIASMLQSLCNEIYISCREEQQWDSNEYPLLVDSYTDMGPFGAILSAFKKAPDKAWLVVACDLPLLDKNTLEYLITHRDRNSIATAFVSAYDGLPEPLITIWEPAAYTYLLALSEEGYKCPRKALIKSDNITLLQPPNPTALMNTNTPEDAEKAMELLQQMKAGEYAK